MNYLDTIKLLRLMILEITEILFELSHGARYKIFRELNKKHYKHSELEKKLKLPGPEITRHIKRLLKFNLIKIDQDRTYYRTNLGKLFDNSLDFFEFNMIFRDFINTHDIEAIPSHLLLDLGILKNCRLLTQTMENIELWSKIVKEAKNFIWSISEQILDTDLPIIQQKILNQKLEIRSIMHTALLNKYIQTKEWEKYIEGPKPEIFKHLSDKLGIPNCIRKADDLKIALSITESKVLLFLSNDKKIDYSECIYGENNQIVINWAKSIFEYYWNVSKPINKEELLL